MGRGQKAKNTAADGEPPAAAANRAWWCANLLVLAVFLVGARRLVLGEGSGIWDADSQFAPYQMLVGDFARAGRLLLWNPWNNGGSPDGFEPQFGAFSPLNTGLGLLLGGRELAFRVYWLLIWMAGGLGLLRFGRHLGAPVWGAVAVSLGFLFSGIYTGHAQATPFLISASALPWVLWRVDVALARRSVLAAVQAGALHGLAGLSGHPAFTIVTSGFVVLWVVGRWLWSENDATERAPAVTALAVLGNFFAVAFVVLAPVYLGFLIENEGFTFKTGPLPRQTVTQSNVLEVGALTTFASPYLMIVKAANSAHLWPRTDLSSCSLYLTALVTALAVAALFTSPWRSWRFWVFGVGCACLLAALAEPVPVRGWIYDFVPPTRYFRHAAVFRIYFMFVLAVLALLATRDVARASGERGSGVWKTLTIVSGVLTLLAGASLALVERGVAALGPELGRAHAHAALAWLGTGVLAILGWRGVGRGPLAGLAIALVAADALAAAELDRWTMYLPRARWKEIEARRSWSLDLRPHGLDRLPRFVFDGMLDNKNFALKVPVLQSYSTLENPFHQRWVEDPALVTMATGPARTWFSSSVVSVAPSPQNWAAFQARAHEVDAAPLVVHTPASMRGAAVEGEDVGRIGGLPAAVPIEVLLATYEPNRLTFAASAPSDGWLWVTERWARSWSATVNGRAAEVYGANFIFRALRVSAGPNAVVFTYQPVGHPWLALASWACLAAVGAWTALGWCWPAAGGSQDRTSRGREEAQTTARRTSGVTGARGAGGEQAAGRS